MHLTALYTKTFVRRLSHIEVESSTVDSPDVREQTRGAKCIQAANTSPDEVGEVIQERLERDSNSHN